MLRRRGEWCPEQAKRVEAPIRLGIAAAT